MIYSEFYLKKSWQWPTWLSVFFVVLLAGLFVSLFSGGARLSKASAKTIKRLEITNISPVQATIFWVSETQETGYVMIGEQENQLTKTVYDDRDTGAIRGQYKNHLVTVRDLVPGRQYFFRVFSGDRPVTFPGRESQFSTPKVAKTQNGSLRPANGIVRRVDESAEDNAVVYLLVKGYQPMTALTKSTGEWLIPLTLFYDNSLEAKTLSGQEGVTIDIQNESGQKVTITGRLAQLADSKTVIIGGQKTEYPLDDVNVLGTSDAVPTPSKRPEIAVYYPTDDAVVPGRSPIIKGQALPGKKVNITIKAKKIISTVVVAATDGIFKYVVPEKLDLGENKLSVTTENTVGETVTLTRKFRIVANDNEGKVLGVASDEATLTPTATLTQSPTVLPTATPTVAFYTPPTTTPIPQVPVTGVSDNWPIYGGISLLLGGLGMILVF